LKEKDSDIKEKEKINNEKIMDVINFNEFERSIIWPIFGSRSVVCDGGYWNMHHH
jgi:hypothetical protein